MNRKEETKIVKDALKKVGIEAKVKHGTGTAYGWLKIYIPNRSQEKCAEVISIAQAVTGRTGDYDGRINVHSIN